jgi:hypothetical protein
MMCTPVQPEADASPSVLSDCELSGRGQDRPPSTEHPHLVAARLIQYRLPLSSLLPCPVSLRISPQSLRTGPYPRRASSAAP